ncbi:MAG: tRNA 2-selenouridine(34) synthase MnmH [Flavobacteriales bacterium]|nr:tRNA 2-selenouridine(34) synthase MnmH [Flavobacteriales bacterium]
MLHALPITDWLALSTPIIDVRSPGEFQRGHIPNAINLPLFSNEERAVVGTIYKKQGRDPALLEGLRLVGPKLAHIVEEAWRIAPEGRIRVHCWRGGERSGSVGWLLDKAGFKEVLTLKRGYKGFRNHVLQELGGELHLKVLGGFTGSGKTETLDRLQEKGEQIIDLEALASHKGSSFGGLGAAPQPTTEHFENRLWCRIRSLDRERPIWVEDESAMIGRINLPRSFYEQMRAARLYFVKVPVDQRAARLLSEYGSFPKEDLAEAIKRIARRLGPQHCKRALEALGNDDLREVVLITLGYYDRSYLHGVSKRDPRQVVELSPLDPGISEIASLLIRTA